MSYTLRLRLIAVFSLLFILVSSLALVSYTRLTAHAANASITLSPSKGLAYTPITITGTGFGSSEQIYISSSAMKECPSPLTDKSGSFTATCTVSDVAQPGSYKVTVIGTTSEDEVQALFTVLGSNWSMDGYDAQQTRFNPNERVVSPSNASSLSLDWSYPLSAGITTSPVMAGKAVYVGSYDGKLYAFNVATSTVLWVYPLASSFPTSASVGNAVVYMSARDGTLYALNSKTGALLWSYVTGGSLSKPVVTDDVIYIGSDKLYALDATTHLLKWSYVTGSNVGPPTIANGMVYASSGNALYALDAHKGTLLWSHPLATSVLSTIAAVGRMVYFTTAGRYLYALDATTGRVRWQYLMGGKTTMVPLASPAVANGVVYLRWDNKLHAVDATTGKSLWEYRVPDADHPRYHPRGLSSPSVANGVVYFGFETSLYVLDATSGAFLWKYTTRGVVDFSPAIAQGVIYVGSLDTKLYAFHLPGTTA